MILVLLSLLAMADPIQGWSNVRDPGATRLLVAPGCADGMPCTLGDSELRFRDCPSCAVNNGLGGLDFGDPEPDQLYAVHMCTDGLTSSAMVSLSEWSPLHPPGVTQCTLVSFQSTRSHWNWGPVWNASRTWGDGLLRHHEYVSVVDARTLYPGPDDSPIDMSHLVPDDYWAPSTTLWLRHTGGTGIVEIWVGTQRVQLWGQLLPGESVQIKYPARNARFEFSRPEGVESAEFEVVVVGFDYRVEGP